MESSLLFFGAMRCLAMFFRLGKSTEVAYIVPLPANLLGCESRGADELGLNLPFSHLLSLALCASVFSCVKMGVDRLPLLLSLEWQQTGAIHQAGERLPSSLTSSRHSEFTNPLHVLCLLHILIQCLSCTLSFVHSSQTPCGVGAA